MMIPTKKQAENIARLLVSLWADQHDLQVASCTIRGSEEAARHENNMSVMRQPARLA